MNKMRLMVALASFWAINILAYDITIINQTDGELKVTLQFAGKGVCGDNTFTMVAHSDATTRTGGCCPENIRFEATSGKGAGKGAIDYWPPPTLFGISCRDSAVRVYNAANGSLIATIQ